MSVFANLVEQLADLLQPLFHASATAAAIVLFTALVRLTVHPSHVPPRGQKAKARLSPQIAELRKKHGKNPERLQKAMLELHTKEKVSPLSGCLPSLLQLPAFFLMYHLFSSSRIGGEPNRLLGHTLFDAPSATAGRMPSHTAGCSEVRASCTSCSSRSSQASRSSTSGVRSARWRPRRCRRGTPRAWAR